MMVGINLSTSGGFQTWSDNVVPVSDGAVHEYELFVWQIKDPPVRQLPPRERHGVRDEGSRQESRRLPTGARSCHGQ